MNSPSAPDPDQTQPAVKGAALVGKALELLNLIGGARTPISATELTARSGWPRANVYRILSALTAAGYARLDAQERGYLLGYRLLELVQNGRQADNLTAIAAPELRRLRDMTGETGYLVTIENGTTVSLGRFESAHAHRSIGGETGGRRPLHCTAHGKAMLANLPAAEIELLIEPERLDMLTPATITDPDELRLQLAEIRARGYSVDDEEIVPGVRAVGAAIIAPDGRVLGGISVAGPAYRLTPGRAKQLGPEIAAAARHIGMTVAEARPPTTDPVGAQPLDAAPGAAETGMAPLWNAAEGRLIWGDARGRGVFATDAQKTVTAMPALPAPATALLLGPNGPVALLNAVIAGGDAAGVLRTAAAPDLSGVTALRTDKNGAVWAARQIVGDPRAEIGPLRAGRITPIWRVPGPVTSLAWDHEQGTLYAAARTRGSVHALRSGSPARLLARLPAASGAPSALAVDVDGRVWAALLNGWGVVRLTEFGDVDATLALPVPRPTGLTFGGPGLRTLFITTARHGIDPEIARNAPLSGRVFALGMGVPGWAEPVATLDLS